MKTSLLLSAALASILAAAQIEVQKVVIEEEASTEAKTLGAEEIRFTRQQDLGEILFELLPEVNLVRASAIGNDLVLRGFKRDDITVLLDGAKIYGACPNRMDPPAMHVSISDIEKIEVLEGPFDVEHFGSMGGEIRVKTKDPAPGFGGSVDLIYGSWHYNKEDLSVHGGDERLAVSLRITHESSDQYEDGHGRTLVEQNWEQLGKNNDYAYQEKYAGLNAYTRNAIRAKALLRPAENQKLRLSFLTDKATDVLYPAFQMDAQLDKTLHVNGEYEITDLAAMSKKLVLQGYYSAVTHDMGTEFRNAALPTVMDGMMYRTHHTRSEIKGAKVKNEFEAGGALWTLGLDGSQRNWKGICLNEPSGTPRQVRIPDVDTENRAIFVKGRTASGPWSFKWGLRYDSTDIDANGLDDPTIANIAAIQNYYRGKESKSYDDLSANFVAKYSFDAAHSAFVALGQGVRVPDAQELYFIGFMKGNWSRKGNPDLKEAINREIDLGYEGRFGAFSVRATLFYSKIKDYIYAYKTNDGQANPKAYYLTWTNIDANIYGGDVSLYVPLGDFLLAEAGAAYQRGKKDDAIPGQSDEDMAMIAPLKGRVALSYDDGDYFGMVEVLASAGYENYDADNGEREIGGWAVVNLKGSKELSPRVKLNVGVDNLFDKAYAVNNTYVGRALIGGDEPVLIYEPGRFVYASLTISF